MNEEKQKNVIKMQNNLATIRKIAGWTTEDLANKIGVTKQTIWNIENHKTDLTYANYCALKETIEEEMQNNKENTLLKGVVDVLLYKSDPDDEKYEEKEKLISTLAAAKSDGKTDEEIIEIVELVATIAGVALSAVPIGLGLAALLDSIFNKKL